MKPLLLLLLSLALLTTLPPAPSKAQGGPPRARLAQTGQICQQVLADPAITITSAASPWIVYQPTRSFATDQASSAPASIFMPSGAIGQEFTIPSTLSDLYGTLRYRYATGSVGPGDRLRVELYRVGQINAQGLIATLANLDASTVPTNSWEWIEADATPALVEQLRALSGGRAVVVVRALSAGSSPTRRLWLDDIELFTCAPSLSLRGRVTRADLAVAGAQVLLTRSDSAGTQVLSTARTTSDGHYGFTGVPPLTSGVSYRLWYLSAPDTLRPPGRLGFWAGPQLTILPSNPEINGLNMEVGDLALLAPEPHAQVTLSEALPVTLRWQRRAVSVPGERHRLCLYDPARGDPQTDLPLELCGPPLDPTTDRLTFDLRPSSFAATPGFSLIYGRSYRWYVAVSLDNGAQYGHSFGERAITLLSATPAPAPEPAPEPSDPEPTPAAPADWTLMIYMAADNAIGDPARAPLAALPEAQLAALPSLAGAHPQVNLVSLVDSFGSDGLSLCAYPASGAPECQQRPEASSASSATLGDFIDLARRSYPAARTALLIIAPANAAGELAYDETSGVAMSLRELQAAYEIGGLVGDDRLDLVIYQAPLLGSVEVLLATAPYARLMVAAPDQIWQLAPYAQLVPLLAEAADPAAAARGAVDAYAQAVESGSNARAVAIAAYDLARASALRSDIDTLAAALSAGLVTERAKTRPALATARAAAQAYDSSGNGRHNALATSDQPLALAEDALVDLRDFATLLRDAGTAPDEVLVAAEALAGRLADPERSPLIAATLRTGLSISGQQLSLARGHGLAIFLPSGDRLGGQPALSETQLYATAPDSAWSIMLRVYLAEMLGAGPGGVTEALGAGPRHLPGPGGFVLPNQYSYLPLIAR